MKKMVILDDYQDVALSLADWRALQGQIVVRSLNVHVASEDALVEQISDAHVLFMMRERTPLTAGIIDRLPNLQLIVTSGMRNASLDFDAARRKGILICGTESMSRPPMELTWALLMALSRSIHREHRNITSNGPWQSTIGTDLYGKNLGVVGLGKIGKEVAKLGQAFGMKVHAWSPNLTPQRAQEDGVDYASQEDLFKASDFLTIHMVLSPDTRHIVGRAELALMKKTAYLINTSRAALVDETALIAALQGGAIAGAALDVFEQEPLPVDHPYRSLSNVLATPHLGYVTLDNYKIYFRQALENVEAWLAGQPIRVLE